MKEIVEVYSKEELDAVYKAQESKKIKKVLIKFYADKCPPCHMLDVTIHEYVPKDDMIIVKIHAGKASDLKKEFDIKSVPICFIVDLKGNIITQKGGYMKKPTFEAFVNEFYFGDGIKDEEKLQKETKKNEEEPHKETKKEGVDPLKETKTDHDSKEHVQEEDKEKSPGE